ncbi:hypothetical protein GCM10022255_093390 [Dactylosporangium darangshiense]|uniref:Uncharacterized protein n=1 Tax=Dactylosporangium darangshiense TaxID=579108 RepID=A0ABP8DQB7_9ACTN
MSTPSVWSAAAASERTPGLRSPSPREALTAGPGRIAGALRDVHQRRGRRRVLRDERGPLGQGVEHGGERGGGGLGADKVFKESVEGRRWPRATEVALLLGVGVRLKRSP